MISILLWLAIFTLSNGDTTAIGVYGQGGSFSSNFANKGGLSTTSLSIPTAVTIDPSDNVYIVDAGNNRVLFFAKGSTTASRVYGQGGSFTSSTGNNGGISADSLLVPTDIAINAAGNIYIADSDNNRVLKYPGASTTATLVYGQGGSFTTNIANIGGISASTLYRPNALLIDSSGNLYVADGGNNRVLFYPVGSTTATRVYGQNGLFNAAAFSPISANSLFSPNGLAVDSSNNLYIADGRNSRILFYPSGSTTATRVYGQGGSFTSGDFSNPGGVTANTLSLNRGIYLDSSNNLYAADGGNNRVLFYPAGITTATRVYGQLNSMTANTANTGGISASSLLNPYDIAIDSAGTVYISDGSNNRVLTYDNSSSTLPPGGTPAPAGTKCFHTSTNINYNGKLYTHDQLMKREEKDCYVPHTVKADGLKFEIVCDNGFKTDLRLTDDHLVATRAGLQEAKSLGIGHQVFGDLEGKIKCHITSRLVEQDQTYFGLNCLRSVVLANGIKTSTFGTYHVIPTLWMQLVGGLIGIEDASKIGDKIATRLKHHRLI